ncbi:MAG: hypothetical protein IJW00_04790 [Clostridia bacterium]|nr:hypothetical protein [Clostridia bacterium]
MYAFESHPRKGMLHVLTAGCFITALLLLGLSGLEGMSYPFVYQFTAFALLTAGVYLMVRYILKRYRYEITESDITNAAGVPLCDLVITEIGSAKHRVVTRVSVREITSVALINPKTHKIAEKEFIGNTKRVWRYLNTPLTEEGIYLAVPEETSVVVIPHDPRMLEILKAMITK